MFQEKTMFKLNRLRRIKKNNHDMNKEEEYETYIKEINKCKIKVF